MLKKSKIYFSELLRSSYLFVALFWSYLSGTAWYFILLKKGGNNLGDFIFFNIRGGSDLSFFLLFGGYVLVSMLLVILYRKEIKKRIIPFSILPLVVLIGYFISGNSSIGKFIYLIILAAASSLFASLTFLFPAINSLKKYSKIIFLPFCIFLIAFLCLSLFRHYNFLSHAFDLGIFNQAFYKFSHFEFDNTIRNVSNLWGDHFHLILFPLSLLYWIFPFSSLTLILQALIVVLGGVPLYLIGLDVLKSRASSIFIVCAYLGFYGIASAIDFDFHEITIATSFLLLAFYFAWKEKWGWYFISLLLLLSCKEDVAIIVIFLGIFLGILKRNWKIGLATSICGLAWFGVVTKILIPHLSPEGFVYFDYKVLGKGPMEAVKSVIFNPFHAFYALADDPEKLRTMQAYFASFGFLPILAPTFLFLALPAVGENLWHTSPSRWGGFHYEAIAAPIFAITSIFAIRNIVGGFDKKFRYKLVVVLSFFVLVSSFAVACEMRSPLFKVFNPTHYKIKQSSLDTLRVIKVIPKDASVTTYSTITPHLAARDKIYEFPKCNTGECLKSDYFVLSLVSPQWAMTNQALKEEIQWFLEGKEFRSDYGLYLQDGAGFIFKRGYKADESSVRRAFDYLNYYNGW